ncbi:MAG: RagB/SusD family nutrient uptake outer membrane protein [Bacteroidota bacterium]
MKYYLYFTQSILSTVVLVIILLTAAACETDFPNPNNPTEGQVLTTREGLLALSLGVKREYSTSGLRFLIETPAITTREGGITTTFQNMIELEDGGADLPNFNTNVAGLWSTMLRVVNSCNDLIRASDEVPLAAETRNSIVAFAQTFKGMAIGALAQHYTDVVTETSPNNDAAFSPRIQAFNLAIRSLEMANTALGGGDVTEDFQSDILGSIDLPNTIDAMLARFNLYAGNFQPAINSATAVDLSVASTFQYDAMNANPIWVRVFLGGAPNFKPRDNFGIDPSTYVYDDNDGRLAFYLVPLDTTNQNTLPIEDLAGFFDSETGEIPLYLPDEMRLIIAEAELRLNMDTDAALTQINLVRNDTEDLYGVNADIGDYAGPTTVEDLLNEIYFQRRAELFLTGQSLEDSRRFGRPEPSTAAMVFTDERNRNFYPFPDRERNNNPNTPADPSI